MVSLARRSGELSESNRKGAMAKPRNKPTTLVAVLDREKETKRTVKFAERVENEFDDVVVGSLYVQKKALESLGALSAEAISIEIKVG